MLSSSFDLNPSVLWTALCGALIIVVIILLLPRYQGRTKTDPVEEKQERITSASPPPENNEAPRKILSPGAPTNNVDEVSSSSLGDEGTNENRKVKEFPSLASQRAEGQTSNINEQDTSTINDDDDNNNNNSTMEMENNWRCACEGGFLPPSLLKTFGGAEAVFKLGTGQCYHKQM